MTAVTSSGTGELGRGSRPAIQGPLVLKMSVTKPEAAGRFLIGQGWEADPKAIPPIETLLGAN